MRSMPSPMVSWGCVDITSSVMKQKIDFLFNPYRFVIVAEWNDCNLIDAKYISVDLKLHLKELIKTIFNV